MDALELATVDQLVAELGKRFDIGLIVVSLRTSEGDEGSEDFIVHQFASPTVATGMLHRATQEIERDARINGRRQRP